MNCQLIYDYYKEEPYLNVYIQHLKYFILIILRADLKNSVKFDSSNKDSEVPSPILGN